jgi:hypothetical protein
MIACTTIHDRLHHFHEQWFVQLGLGDNIKTTYLWTTVTKFCTPGKIVLHESHYWNSGFIQTAVYYSLHKTNFYGSTTVSDVYERLIQKGKKPGFLQLLGTQTVSAIWHVSYLIYISDFWFILFGDCSLYFFHVVE